MLICDTSGLLASLDTNEQQHERCDRLLTTATSTPVVSPFVVAELDHLLGRRFPSAVRRTALRSLRGLAWAPWDGTDLARAVDVDERYADLGLGITDCSLVVLAERYGTRDLLTLDERHFRAVAPLQGGSFRLLPADA